jgi:DNA-binding MarR family transcriptional regulator
MEPMVARKRVITDTALSKMQNIVLDYLRGLHMNSRQEGLGDYAFPRQKVMAKKLEYTTRGIQKAIEVLVAKKYVRKMRHPHSRRRNVYQVLSRMQQTNESTNEGTNVCSSVPPESTNVCSSVPPERILVSAFIPRDQQQHAAAAAIAAAQRDAEQQAAREQAARDQHDWDGLDQSDQQAIERAAVKERPSIAGSLNRLRLDLFCPHASASRRLA